MSAQILENWKEYLSEVNYEILKEFIECVESEKIFRKGENKILCFRGPGSTGKSALLKEIEKLVDQSKLAYLQEEKYDAKLIVCVEYDPKLDSLLKSYLSSDPIYQRKIYEEGIKYLPECNIICVTDSSENMDETILNRMVFVDFSYIFK